MVLIRNEVYTIKKKRDSVRLDIFLGMVPSGYSFTVTKKLKAEYTDEIRSCLSLRGTIHQAFSF